MSTLLISALDVRAVLEIEPGNKLAKESCPRLENLHKEKMDKMKDEAVGEQQLLHTGACYALGIIAQCFCRVYVSLRWAFHCCSVPAPAGSTDIRPKLASRPSFFS